MAIDDDNRRPRDSAEVLASAATLVGLAIAPGRRRFTQAARLSCVPFLFRNRPTAASAGGQAEGAPLQWAWLPLASLLPWLSLLVADSPQSVASAPTSTPSIDGRPESTRVDREHVRARSGAGSAEEHALGLAPLPLRASAPRSPVGHAVLALRSQPATPASVDHARRAAPSRPAVAAEEPAHGPVWPAPAGMPRPGADAPPEAPGRVEAATPAPRSPAPGEFRWELPQAARPRPRPTAGVPVAAPVVASIGESLPQLPSRRPAAPPAESQPSPPPAPERLPTLHPKTSAMHVDFSQVVAQIVRQVRTEVTETVTTEVQRAAVKLAQTNPPPGPSEVLAELYTDHSIRKLLARMRRVEQEERRRGGLI